MQKNCGKSSKVKKDLELWSLSNHTISYLVCFLTWLAANFTYQTNKLASPLSSRKYKPITTYEQRCLYKTDFQAEYEVYKTLKEKVDSVLTKFTELQNKQEQFPKGSVERQVCSLMSQKFIFFNLRLISSI